MIGRLLLLLRDMRDVPVSRTEAWSRIHAQIAHNEHKGYNQAYGKYSAVHGTGNPESGRRVQRRDQTGPDQLLGDME